MAITRDSMEVRFMMTWWASQKPLNMYLGSLLDAKFVKFVPTARKVLSTSFYDSSFVIINLNFWTLHKKSKENFWDWVKYSSAMMGHLEQKSLTWRELGPTCFFFCSLPSFYLTASKILKICNLEISINLSQFAFSVSTNTNV